MLDLELLNEILIYNLMKHLRLFEELEGFYQEIYSYELKEENFIQFTNQELTDIKNLVTNKYKSNDYAWKTIYKQCCLKISINNKEVGIYKCIDEWWCVEVEVYEKGSGDRHYYKCDQWEGLMKLMKDKDVI